MGERMIQFHVGRSGHAFFREQLYAAPAGFTYGTPHPQLQANAAATRRLATHARRLSGPRVAAEWTAIRSLSYAGYVRRVRVGALPGAALVHSGQFLIRDSKLPYVVEFECLEAFTLYQRVALRRPWARARLLHALADARLRFLLPWSEVSRRGLRSALGPSAAALADRTITVLPA